MPKICYQPKRFSGSRQALIDQCNVIIVEYAGQGFILTLRQLYYQLVSRNMIENKLSDNFFGHIGHAWMLVPRTKVADCQRTPGCVFVFNYIVVCLPRHEVSSPLH